jgi:hypothetical protein
MNERLFTSGRCFRLQTKDVSKFVYFLLLFNFPPHLNIKSDNESKVSRGAREDHEKEEQHKRTKYFSF